MDNYLNFNKEELVNLEYSLSREVLGTNRIGGYISTTIIGCNTRKYHGLLVCPIDELDGENYVLLSSLDETIIQHQQEFNLAIHKYPNVYDPKGNKYIIDCKYDSNFILTYRIGDLVLKKEFMIAHNKDQVFISYTLLESQSSVIIRLRPFLAFRSRHKLSKANLFVNTHSEEIDKGISSKLYEGFPNLNMQLSHKNKFISKPDWYYNIEYSEEKKRGYDYSEDLFTPGYFELPMNKRENIIFSASLHEEKSNQLLTSFTQELKTRYLKNNFLNCLKHSASQFIVKRKESTEIVAGYPWFGRWGRDTFIALPGLTLADNFDPNSCKAVLDTMSNEINNGLFPNIGKDKNAAYNSVDAPMWYFWAVQKYAEYLNEPLHIWQWYGEKLKNILKTFRDGTQPNICMHKNGLIWAKEDGKALTWMDAVINNIPVTPRAGYVVEINALWYNAIQFTLELAEKNGDKEFIVEWKDLPKIIEDSFFSTFWNDRFKYLADFVDEKGQNMDIRPNQIIAASLPYSPLNQETINYVVDIIKQKLLTPKGLRTLSPEHRDYQGFYSGDQQSRDRAYHQGTVWVWQLSHYVEANFKLYGKAFSKEAEQIVSNFKENMTEYGISSISEVFDGNPPHLPGGSISQAWSVSEILRIIQLIKKYKVKK